LRSAFRSGGFLDLRSLLTCVALAKQVGEAGIPPSGAKIMTPMGIPLKKGRQECPGPSPARPRR
jgi:hypothetical protein